MSGMDRLLPCPFCGGTEADGTIERAHGTKYVMHNEDDDCAAFRGALIPTQHWNRRASRAAPAPQKPVAWCASDSTGRVLSVSMSQYPWHPTPLYAAPATSDGLREAVDAAWNDAIEAAAEAKGYEHLAERAAIRALRRAAPTEGEA